MSLRITAKLTGSGWAEFEVSDANRTCTITASYLSDATRSLILGGTLSLSAYRNFSFSFDEEPGEYRWVVSSNDPNINDLDISIVEFDLLWGSQADSEGKVIFQTTCSRENFSKSVLTAINEMLQQTNETEYEDKWHRHPFPKLQFDELSRLVQRFDNDLAF